MFPMIVMTIMRASEIVTANMMETMKNALDGTSVVVDTRSRMLIIR